MPELPEVESVRRSLAPHLVGRRIAALEAHVAKLRWPLDEASLRRCALGRTVAGLRRRAKYLLVDLVDASDSAAAPTVLAVHLGMTGWLGLVAATATRRPHDHVSVTLDDDRVLRLYDPRRFGAMFSFAAADEAKHPRFRALGPEPLDVDAFDGEVLYAASRKAARYVKTLLMDAHCVVGVGNIYASEALFRAGVHPHLSAKRLSRVRAASVAAAVRQTLHEAIELGGTTLRDFSDAEGVRGTYAPRLLVYGRAGLPCRRCGATVRRMVSHGRSTFYCSGCQRR